MPFPMSVLTPALPASPLEPLSSGQSPQRQINMRCDGLSNLVHTPRQLQVVLSDMNESLSQVRQALCT